MSLATWIRLLHSVRQDHRVSHWRPDRVARLQAQRLRRLLAWSTRHSPFYREKFAGIDVARCALADLPSTTQTEMRAAWDEVVTSPACRYRDLEQFVSDESNASQWYQGKYAVCRTSGHQEQPLLVVQDRSCLETAASLLISRALNLPPRSVVAALAGSPSPQRVAVIRQRRGFLPSHSLVPWMQVIGGSRVQIRTLTDRQADLVSELRSFQPHVLVGSASLLESLASQPQELKLAGLKRVLNIGEQLPLAVRARIEIAWDVPVINHYGMAECLHLADGCTASNGLHINADWAIVESVDHLNRPVPPGMKGSRILATNLANRIQPFIRYEVTDRLTLSSCDCPCGSQLPVIRELEGRGSDQFWVQDGCEARILSGGLFHTALAELGWVREWQAVQVQRNRIELKIQMGRDVSPSTQQVPKMLLASLDRHGLPSSVSCDIQIVPEIRANVHAGRPQRMVSRLGGHATAKWNARYARG